MPTPVVARVHGPNKCSSDYNLKKTKTTVLQYYHTPSCATGFEPLARVTLYPTDRTL